MNTEQNSLVYLNTAGCGLISEASLQAAAKVYNEFSYNSSGRSESWREKEEPVIRGQVARFMGVKPSEIAFIPNFSYAINTVVQSLRGDEKVLLYREDYPSVTEPFLNKHFSVHWIEPASNDAFFIDTAEIERMIAEKGIEILSISHVQWRTGFKIDLVLLSRICRQYNTRLILDVTQSLGAIPIAIETLGIDAVIASNYKWMNSGFGNGLMYLSPSFLAQYPPLITGANSSGFSGLVRSYEPGGLNIYALSLLQQAIQEKEAMGQIGIVQHNLQLTQTLLNGLALLKDKVQLLGDYTVEHRASIVVLKDTTNQSGRLGDWLEKNKIIVTQRNQTLRISIHFYNTAEQIKILLDAVNQWAK